MQDIPKEQIIKRFQILPESLQNEIFSEKSADAIIKHCALRDVPNDKMPVVGQLSTRVLLGYLRPELFALEIQKETGIDMQKAQLVAHDLDMEIFSAVRLELKKLSPPTIQTPTVQSWMAQKPELQKPELRIMNYELRKEEAVAPMAKPRYVIPIPEKFLNLETRNIKLETQGQKPAQQQEEKSNVLKPDLQQPTNQESRIRNYELGIMNKETQAKEKESAQTVIHNSNFVIQKGTEPKQPTENTQEKQIPQETFKPIVPLPTFIQTQFRTTQVNPQKAESRKEDTTTPNSTLANDPRIKSIISKFTTSSTQKPKPPAESPYREKI